HIEPTVIVTGIVAAGRTAAVKLTDDHLVLVPQPASAAAGFGGAGVPARDLPAIGRPIAHIDVLLADGIVRFADLLDVAAGVVYPADRIGRGAALVPAAVERVVLIGRYAAELQEGHVRGAVAHQHGAVGHGLVN